MNDYLWQLHCLQRKHGRHFPDLAQAIAFDLAHQQLTNERKDRDQTR